MSKKGTRDNPVVISSDDFGAIRSLRGTYFVVTGSDGATDDTVLTVSDLLVLAEIVKAAYAGKHVAYIGASGDTITGTARSVGDINGNFLLVGDDVRDAYLRVTCDSGTEAFIPVSVVASQNREGKFSLDYSG